jgi:guanylate kinase
MIGKSIIISAPSGAGKTSIVRYLLVHEPRLAFSVSATSRPPRQGETDGVDYQFITDQEFRKRIAAGDFLEWEEVYAGRYYGTLRANVEALWQAGRVVIFDLDVVGGSRLKQLFGESALAIFVQPPSMEALEERLRSRSTETPETLRARVEKALVELTFAERFDHIVINDRLEDACSEALHLVRQFIDP